jgi:small subunit ribosomal protein S12
MPTTQQLINKGWKKKIKKNSKKALDKNPQKKGFCLKVFVATPKKPNSALRKVARVFLSNKKKVTCHIPGEKHKLQKHSSILIQGYRVRDLPGVSFRGIRNKYDLKGVINRMQGRSKYGVKNPYK